MVTKVEKRGFQSLFLQRANTLAGGELELLCYGSQGISVPVADILAIVSELQKLVFRVGEFLLGLDYRKSGRPKSTIRDRLSIVVGIPKSKSAFSLRLKIGDFDSIPFPENGRFQAEVINMVGSILTPTDHGVIGMENSDYARGIEKIVYNLKQRTKDFESVFVLGIKGKEGQNIIGLK
jgi:hypothetical protein